jgi:DNA-binding XRE family transcriptional regulator
MKMKATKKRQLESKGWRVSNTADFLELTPEEAAIVEIRAALSTQLKRRRTATMTQDQLARRIGSSQSRIAMAENGAKSVSLDLLMRALIATGATPQDIGKTIAKV